MYAMQLSPYVRVAMDHRMQPGATIFERMIWDYEILYLKHGELEITIENDIYQAIAGDVFLFKPRQRHSIRVVGQAPVDQPHVHFDMIEKADSDDVTVSFKLDQEMDEVEKEWFRDDVLSGTELFLPNHIRLRNTQPFEDILFKIIHEYQMKIPYFKFRLKGLIMELLACLLRDSNWLHRLDEPDKMDLLVEIQQYMNLHANRHLTLDELSDRFHVNKHYLISLFKSAFSITPMQYHQQMRLERAKNMLNYTQMQMQEISDTLGYPTIHAFSRAFKNKEGCSPSSYRSSIIQTE